MRTEDVEVRDLHRSPIAIGAALTMASMPFDVHSAALGGTRQWTHLALRFVASRARGSHPADRRQWRRIYRARLGSRASRSMKLPRPAIRPRATVRTFGPAYRYPAAGWIYLHIEGKPYERGYQHGHLMAREIPEYLERCAADLGAKAEQQSWDQLRTTANALVPARLRPAKFWKR